MNVQKKESQYYFKISICYFRSYVSILSEMYVKIKLKSLELEKADLSATQDYISLFRKKRHLLLPNLYKYKVA